MAFGTGQHATTRACLELLASLPAGGSLLDAGCGSGVLAIAARRLGFDPVWALDADPLAVEATLGNARRNGVGLRVARRTIGEGALPAADVVLANLTGGLLAELAPALPEPGPRALVASGHAARGGRRRRGRDGGPRPAGRRAPRERRLGDAAAGAVRHTFRYLVAEAPAAGQEVALSPDDSHHLSRVVRRRPGDEVELTDGAGRLWPAVVVATGARATVRVRGAQGRRARAARSRCSWA